MQNAGLRNGRDHWQWKAIDPVDGEEYFMLNTDFELFFDLDLNGEGQAVCILDNTCDSTHTCGKNGICPKAETFDQAATYAHVNNQLCRSRLNDAIFELALKLQL